jgi:hypothetical protein
MLISTPLFVPSKEIPVAHLLRYIRAPVSALLDHLPTRRISPPHNDTNPDTDQRCALNKYKNAEEQTTA